MTQEYWGNLKERKKYIYIYNDEMTGKFLIKNFGKRTRFSVQRKEKV